VAAVEAASVSPKRLRRSAGSIALLLGEQVQLAHECGDPLLRGAFGGEQGVCSRLSGRAVTVSPSSLICARIAAAESADKQARSSNC